MSKILLIGSGGREHAIAWHLAQDARINQIYVATGNGGIAELQNAQTLALNSIEEYLEFAKNHDIDLTIVGPEAPLVEGIVDAFKAAGLSIFGADKMAAQLEGSKQYAKAFMEKYGVKTASYKNFDEVDAALLHLETCAYPVVVKASGLAAGKGVIICQTREEAELAVKQMMVERRFGIAGSKIVIEQYLRGFEASILSFTDGQTILPLLPAKDHKTIGEGGTGENTGGMGVVCPHPSFTTQHQAMFERDILEPTLSGLQAEGMRFAGVIFFGLMITDDGVYLIEYNMRMGDPETQAVLPLLDTPLYDLIEAALSEKLAEIKLSWQKQYAVCVVAASAGYPNAYATGIAINHIEKARIFAQIFIAGAKQHDGNYLTTGGRVLNVVGMGETLEQARNNAYSGIKQIEFKGITYRNDIGA